MSRQDLEFQRGRVLGEAFARCYDVARDVRPAASLTFPEGLLPEVRATARRHKVKTRITRKSGGSCDLLIYKHQHVIEVALTMLRAGEQPGLHRLFTNTEFSHWVWGKLFGYSEDAIEEHWVTRAL